MHTFWISCIDSAYIFGGFAVAAKSLANAAWYLNI
jgi:hypothetical protein